MCGNRKNARREKGEEAAAATGEFDGRKFDFITKLSNAVQLEY
jgi:hypothetical protein